MSYKCNLTKVVNSISFFFFLRLWSCNLEILLICAQYRTENSSQNFNRNPICPILLRSKKFAVLYFCHLFKETKKFQVSYIFFLKIRRDIICCSNKQTNKEIKLFVLINYERQTFFFSNREKGNELIIFLWKKPWINSCFSSFHFNSILWSFLVL